MNIKRNILLNPGPATTTNTVKKALLVPDICPREKEFGELVEQVHDKLVSVVHGEHTHSAVLYAGSGTASVEACLSSIVGDEDCVLILDNGAYGKRAGEIVQSYKIPHLMYAIDWGNYPDINEIEKCIQSSPQLTHFFFVHHETTTGMLNPLSELIELCEKYQLTSIVDAMSSYAGIPIDLQQTSIDFLISSSNKCTQGFAGLSFVIGNEKKIEASRFVSNRNYYLNLYHNYSFWKKTKQFLFTPPVQIVYALNQALDEFFEETQQGRYHRYCQNYEVLIDFLKKMNLECLLPFDQHSKLLTAIIEPQISEYNFEDMHDFLYQKGITIYPGKGAKKETFRIANIGDIYPKDMIFAMNTLQDYFNSINRS